MRLHPNDHAWMRRAETRRVMAALNPAGQDLSRYVGGCVRNAVSGHPVQDVDIATRLTPDEVMRLSADAGLKPVPTGIEHGTVTVVSGGMPHEVTTLRKDVATDGRRAVVAFSQDWAEDAARRDFRLNAIYARPEGAVFDPFDGAADARAGRIVFIGDASARIAEDYLRILRFYRFNAWYGSGAPDPEGHRACVAGRAGLASLSAERVWAELKRLLAAPAPIPALEAMQEGHILDEVLPGALDFRVLFSIIINDREKVRDADALLRIVALAGAEGERVSALSSALKVSRAERARMIAACRTPRLVPGRAPDERARALYKRGGQAVADQLRLAEARGEGEDHALEAELTEALSYERPEFPLTGRDLIAAGFAPGPDLGDRLDAARKAWIDSGFTLGREALLDQVVSKASGGERDT